MLLSHPASLRSGWKHMWDRFQLTLGHFPPHVHYWGVLLLVVCRCSFKSISLLYTLLFVFVFRLNLSSRMFTVSNIIASHVLLKTLSFCEWCGCSLLAKVADSSGFTLCTDRRRVFTFTVWELYEHDTQYALPGNVNCVTCFPLFLGWSLSSSLNSIFSWLNIFFPFLHWLISTSWCHLSISNMLPSHSLSVRAPSSVHPSCTVSVVLMRS